MPLARHELARPEFSRAPVVEGTLISSREAPVGISKLDWVLGFVMPLCIFLEAGSEIYLATSPLAQEEFAIPISLLFIPLALAVTAFRWQRAASYSRTVALLSVAFVLYCLVMSAASMVSYDPAAILYGVQWILVFLWLPYFLTLTDASSRSGFLGGFVGGTIFTVGYYLTAASIEFISYGALVDNGRMAQNLILPGQYQIATYVPTTIAYSVSIVNALHVSTQRRLTRTVLLGLNVGAFLCLVALAAREGLLVYVLATLLIICFRDMRRAVVAVFATFIAAGLFVANIDSLTAFAMQSDVRALEKIADVSEDSTAGRDLMIAEVMTVIEHDPMYGSRFVPPNTQRFGLAVNAPSAHNMYVDAFGWTGMIGGMIFLAFALVLFGSSVVAIFASFRTGFAGGTMPRYGALLLIILLLASNNINVPMRQPVTAPIIAFLIFLVELRKMPIFSAKSD